MAERLSRIEEVKGAGFWAAPSVAALEAAREELRGVMHLKRSPAGPGKLPPKVYDITEDPAGVERQTVTPAAAGDGFAAYRARVLAALSGPFATDPTLQRIRAGEPVGEADLAALVSLVLTQDPTLDLAELGGYYPATAGHLDRAIRAVVGVDAAAVRGRFNAFAAAHPELTSLQVKFLDLLANHIGRAGGVATADLYRDPFTQLDPAGLDGVFPPPLDAAVLAAIGPYAPPPGDPPA